MNTFTPYSAYRPHGLDGTDQAPEHWITWKVTHGFQLVGSGTTPKSDNASYYGGDIPWITTSELRENVITDTKNGVTDSALRDYSTLKLYQSGALAIAMYGATIGRLGILGIPATTNQACCVFDHPEQFDIKFFFYWLWMQRPNLIALSVGGGQPNLSQDDLKKLRVPAPQIPEQTQIARFLDYKTAQLDQLIAQKQALIERLNEQRIALITQAVTRGLNPDTALKDSGVEWLGQVPKGWEVLRFKDRCSIVGGQVDPTSDEYQDMTLIAPDHIEKDSGKIIKFESAKEQGAISGKYYYEAGCVLYSKIRPELNKVCIAETSGLCSADMYAITTDEHMDYRFLYYVMLSKYFYQFAVLESMRVAMPKVNRESLSVLPMVVPPLAEQQDIIDYLTQTTLKIDHLKQVTTDTITRLEEYRTALITAAVTGKIDVRGFKVPESATASEA